mgnify:CR=1 FL=1
MSPDGGGVPAGILGKAVDRTFGNFTHFTETFSAAAAGQFGSGWAWLASDAQGNLSVLSTANQDSPLSLGLTPIIGIDVWEHAYYLLYQNKRPEYIKQFFHVINWNKAGELYQAVC